MSHSEFTSNVCLWVNEYVRRSHLTKDAVAESLGIGRNTLYAKLRGESELTVTEAWELSKLIGISVDELLTTAPRES